MKLDLVDGVVEAFTALAGNQSLRFQCHDIRRNRTGIHGKIVISRGSQLLAHSTFNIERDEDRTRLANKAARILGKVNDADGKEYRSSDLQHELDVFTNQAWDTFVGSQEPEMMAGNAADNPIEFLARPHVVVGGGTILFGFGGDGKSFTAMLLGVSVDSGTNGFWGVHEGPGRRVLFVNLERSAGSVARRLEGINIALGLDPARPLLTMNRRGQNLKDIAEGMKRAIDKYKVELVVLDSITRTGMGDLNENLTGNSIPDMMSAIAPSWLGIGHSPRGDNSHIFGSSMFDYAADVMVRNSAIESGSELAVKLEIPKANDVSKKPVMYLAYSFDDDGVNGVRRPKPDEFPELNSDDSKKPHRERIKAYLEANGACEPRDIAEALTIPQASVRVTLKRGPEFIVIQSSGNRSTWGVVDMRHLEE